MNLFRILTTNLSRKFNSISRPIFFALAQNKQTILGDRREPSGYLPNIPVITKSVTVSPIATIRDSLNLRSLAIDLLTIMIVDNMLYTTSSLVGNG